MISQIIFNKKLKFIFFITKAFVNEFYFNYILNSLFYKKFAMIISHCESCF
jgi:hypothetical protein